MRTVLIEIVAGTCFRLAHRSRRFRLRLLRAGRTVRRAAGSDGQTRRLASFPWVAESTRTAKRVNRLLSITGRHAYLEIGVHEGRTLEAVRATLRVGVDPDPRFDINNLPRGITFLPVPSDDFFMSATQDIEYDLVFVDGLHEFRQTYRDLVSALNLLSRGGCILIDDVIPLDEVAGLPSEDAYSQAITERNLTTGAWMGDVWRVVLALDAAHSSALDWRTINDTKGRYQTLVWKRLSHSVQADERTCVSVAEMNYSSVFADGIPPAFRVDHFVSTTRAFASGRSTAP